MRIIQIDVNYDHSSTGKIVKDLQTALKSAGHECLVAYGRGDSVASSDVIRIATSGEVIFHAAMTRVTGLTGYFSPIATMKIMRLLKEFRPDVLHVHELHGYYVNAERVLNYASELGCKIVWTFHCEFSYTGKCGYALNCQKWKNTCGSCPQLHEYPKSLLFDATRWMLDRKKRLFTDLSNLTITTPSEWLSRRARDSVAGLHRIMTIPNPIDTSIFKLTAGHKNAYEKWEVRSPIVILTVGSNIMSQLKGGKFIYEIAKMIKRKDVHFVIVGDDSIGPKVQDNVTSIGQIKDKNELAKLYSAADMTMLTSQKETFSMVCAESLACGTPIIGFDSGAPPFVAPAGFGLFTNYADIQTIADWINSFEETRALLKSRADCSKFAISNYGIDPVVRAYLDAYQL